MADGAARRAVVRGLVTVLAAVAVVAPSAILISHDGLLRTDVADAAIVNDQSPEDQPADLGIVDDPPAARAAGATAQPAAGATPNVLWEADPAQGTKVFEGLEPLPGTVTVADDPQGRYGPSFRYETWDNSDGYKERCESRGLRRPDGSVVSLGTAEQGRTFYLGWRALWDPMPTTPGRWIALFQLHVSGVSAGGLNVGPFVLRTLGDGRLYFQDISPDGTDRDIWSAAMPVRTWSSFVIGFRLSSRSSDGWVEFWYNGAQQKLSNGRTRYPGATLWGTHVNPKFGIYRSGANSGDAVAYLNRARLGTTYDAVAP